MECSKTELFRQKYFPECSFLGTLRNHWVSNIFYNVFHLTHFQFGFLTLFVENILNTPMPHNLAD